MRVDFESKAKSGMNVLFSLLAITIMFLLIFPQGPIFDELALSSYGIKNLKLWELISYIFLHGSFFHLFVNMWGLYLFGSIIAPDLGGLKFLTLYMISGITGGLLWVLFNWNSPVPVVGASGALFGLMLATAMLYPNKEFLLLFFPFPIKTKTMVIVYALIEVISMPGGDNIAHLAHLGGFVGAYIYIKSIYGKNVAWDIFGGLGNGAPSARTSAPRGWKVNTYTDVDSGGTVNDDKPVSKAELDRILDKISENGINSLTETEHALLRKAREQMKNRT